MRSESGVFQTSVSQPPGRVPVPGLGGLLTGTWTILETLKFIKFSINKISIIEFSQSNDWKCNSCKTYTILVYFVVEKNMIKSTLLEQTLNKKLCLFVCLFVYLILTQHSYTKTHFNITHIKGSEQCYL